MVWGIIPTYLGRSSSPIYPTNNQRPFFSHCSNREDVILRHSFLQGAWRMFITSPIFWGLQVLIKDSNGGTTLTKTNIAPESRPSRKDSSIPVFLTSNFTGELAVCVRGCNYSGGVFSHVFITKICSCLGGTRDPWHNNPPAKRRRIPLFWIRREVKWWVHWCQKWDILQNSKAKPDVDDLPKIRIFPKHP